jgi:hypothetical protein
VSGIFHILIGGLVIAMSVALFEFIIHSVRKKQKRVSISYFVASLSDAKLSDIEWILDFSTIYCLIETVEIILYKKKPNNMQKQSLNELLKLYLKSK